MDRQAVTAEWASVTLLCVRDLTPDSPCREGALRGTSTSARSGSSAETVGPASRGHDHKEPAPCTGRQTHTHRETPSVNVLPRGLLSFLAVENFKHFPNVEGIVSESTCSGQTVSTLSKMDRLLSSLPVTSGLAGEFKMNFRRHNFSPMVICRLLWR